MRQPFSLGFPLKGEAVICVACCAVQTLEYEHVGDASLYGRDRCRTPTQLVGLAATHDIGDNRP